MTEIKIKKGQYLKDVLPLIPTNVVLLKTLTNIGATTNEMEAPRNSILVQPNVPVIIGKKRKGLLCIYEGVTIDQVIDYLTSDIQFKKIFVTPESFFKVKEAAEFLNIDLYNDYMFLFDESDRITQDSGFRKKITMPIDDFFNFKNKALISATAFFPSDPRFVQQGFKLLKIVPAFDYSKEIELVTTNSVYLSFKKLLSSLSPSSNICVFLNSTNMIGAFVKGLDIKEDSQIYCSRESAYQLKLNDFRHVDDTLKVFRQYNFFTSRFNSAVDIYMDTKPIVIILTDIDSAFHSMVYPSTESVQIVGRFRNGVDKVYHITNVNPEINPMSVEEVKGWLSGCEQTYNDLSALHKAATNPGSKQTLAECLKLVTYSNYLNTDGSKNHFMIDNLFLEEDTKRCYVSEDNFANAYNVPHFKSTHRREEYPASNETVKGLGNGITTSKIVDAIIESLHRINDPDTTYTLDNRQSVLKEFEKSFPEILEGYHVLGADELKKNGYSKKQIKKAIKKKKLKEQKSNYGLLNSLQSQIDDNTDYATSDLKQITETAIRQNKLDLRATIKLLKEFFDIGPRKTLRFDKNKQEVKGYRVIRCKFNRPE